MPDTSRIVAPADLPRTRRRLRRALIYTPKPSQRRSARLKAAVTYAILGLGAVVMLIPFAWLLSTSFKPQQQVFTFPIQWIPHPFVWSNYADVFRTSPFARYLVNTAVITAVGVLGSLIGSSIAAYAFARIRFRGRNAMFAVMLATLMVPPWTVIIPTYIFFGKIGWLNTYLPILVPAFFATPFNTFLMRQFFMTVPFEMEEAARVDGASRWRIFIRIVLPLARPAMIMVAIFGFFYYWNEFLLPLIYLQSQNLYPVSVGVANYASSQAQNYPLMMAASMIALIPPLAMFFGFQRWLIQGIVVSGVKG
jgi:ABC-type glycerol-3-phosphate transport system permease component